MKFLRMVALGLAALIFAVVIGELADGSLFELPIVSTHKPTEEEYWQFEAYVSPWHLPNGAEIDVTQIEFWIYAEDEEKSREAGEPVVGKLEFSVFVQHSESVANGVPMGQIVFRRPTKNFFLMVNEASLPEGIEIDCAGLQYIVWELKSVVYTLSEASG